MSDREQNNKVVEGVGEQEVTVSNLEKKLTANENVVKVKTLELCFDDNTDKKMGIFNDTVEDKIQNAILTAIDSLLPVKSD